jgi:uncharacterized protein YjbJ (UPF0337 family)
MMRESMLATIAGLALLCVGCEKGPAEKAGHKVDETVDTIKHGGHESVENKVEDKVDDARDKVKDATK